MRVLLIGHNVFSNVNNMGKTLTSYFKSFGKDELAQFYIQNKYPSGETSCRKYFRFTDKDALRSVFSFRSRGKEFILSDEGDCEWDERHEEGFVENIYQIGRKRNAFTYISRNALWRIAHWKTKKLLSWVNEFNPDVIFFMSGDYSFMYRIALYIAKKTGKPLVVACVDDYYLYNKNEKSFFGRIQHSGFMRIVRKTMKEASCILTISDSMKEAYEKLFGKKCHTLHTGVKKAEIGSDFPGTKVAYFGNLGLKRPDQLVEIGLTIKELNLPGLEGLDVYSNEKNPALYEKLKESNGVFFHGALKPEEVREKMKECAAIIHTESFDADTVKRTRFSVSTKIAESLMYGPCIIAYGPGSIASIDYLQRHQAAFVIPEKEQLCNGLKVILTERSLRSIIVRNARKLAEENHDETMNSLLVRDWLEEVMNENSNMLEK